MAPSVPNVLLFSITVVIHKVNKVLFFTRVIGSLFIISITIFVFRVSEYVVVICYQGKVAARMVLRLVVPDVTHGRRVDKVDVVEDDVVLVLIPGT